MAKVGSPSMWAEAGGRTRGARGSRVRRHGGVRTPRGRVGRGQRVHTRRAGRSALAGSEIAASFTPEALALAPAPPFPSIRA